MRVRIEEVDSYEAMRLIRNSAKLTSAQIVTLRNNMSLTEHIWVGYASDQFVCCWGLIPPTLASTQAFLWLHTTDAIKGNEFLFVRRSQMAIKEMLKRYETITGVCHVTAEASHRWVRWLGATFGPATDDVMPFVISRGIA